MGRILRASRSSTKLSRTAIGPTQIPLVFSATRTPWEPIPHQGWLTIVGVVGDVRDWAWSEPKSGQLYLPDTQNPSRLMSLVVRSSGDRAQLTAGVRRAIESVDPDQPMTDV